MKKINMLDPAVGNAPIMDALLEAAKRVILSGQYINGPDVSLFEAKTSDFLGCKHSIGVSSGTDALVASLMALDIGVGDEVICPSFTFFATAGSVSRVGATPVFADVCLDSYLITAETIEPLITDRTKAIIPVHLFGKVCDMDSINALGKKHNLHIIEDACQTFGSPLIKNDNLTCYSFFPSKNLGGFGDSGMITTGSDELAEKIKSIRNHGSKVRYYHDYVGGNFRIDTIQAAMLSVKIDVLNEDVVKRTNNALRYFENLANTSSIALPAADFENDIWNQFTIRVLGGSEMRAKLQKHLESKGISSAIYYPLALHMQECYKENGACIRSNLQNTEILCDSVLSLPIAPELSLSDIDLVCSEIIDFYEGNLQQPDP